MADLKSNVITSFTGGELGPNVAGRVDSDDLKSGVRHVENFIPQPQGGLKKFYGTRKIATIDGIGTKVLVPFDGASEPLTLLFANDKMYYLTEFDFVDTGISVQTSSVDGASYVQINDVIKFASKDTMFDINYLGVEGGGHKFRIAVPELEEVPYFPLGWAGNFNHSVVSTGGGASDASKEFVLSVSSAGTEFSLELPAVLVGAGAGKNVISNAKSSEVIDLGAGTEPDYTATVGAFELSFIRVRNGTETELIKGDIGNVVKKRVTVDTGGVVTI
jgi:hypothetical protein